jgi:hypothetical protein
MTVNELADELDKLWDKSFRNPIVAQSANMLRQQAKEIADLKKVLESIIVISDRKHDAWDKAKELLNKKVSEK